MSWDPEMDDPTAVRRRLHGQQPSDVAAETSWDVADEPPPAWRDSAPDPLAPIDPDAPVSGHMPPGERRPSPMDTPEHDWGVASSMIFPTFRPIGTQGVRFDEVNAEAIAAQPGRSHSAPLIDDGPAGLPVVYSIPAGGFDVIVNGEHLVTWGVEAAALQDAAISNLTAWSASAAWTDEVSGDRRLLSSDTGDGWDAIRILLPNVREHLARELGPSGRILVGLPERHLLVAGTLRPDDAEFAALFAEFVVEQSGAADEPIDRRVFELVDGSLVEFADAATA